MSGYNDLEVTLKKMTPEAVPLGCAQASESKEDEEKDLDKYKKKARNSEEVKEV